MKTEQIYKAYEGPNGWYVACEDASGSHYQPASGGSMSREQAERAAERAAMEDVEQDD